MFNILIFSGSKPQNVLNIFLLFKVPKLKKVFEALFLACSFYILTFKNNTEMVFGKITIEMINSESIKNNVIVEIISTG